MKMNLGKPLDMHALWGSFRSSMRDSLGRKLAQSVWNRLSYSLWGSLYDSLGDSARGGIIDAAHADFGY